MQQLTIYKIISFILVPVALFLGTADIMMLLVSLANPTLLLIVFAIACFVIYIIASMRFLLRGIINQHVCSAGLKDWIKVNAYGTLFVFSMFLLNSTAAFFISDVNLRQVLGEMMEQQTELAGKISLDYFVQIFRILSSVLFVISLLAIIHVRMTFRLIRQNPQLFNQS